MYECTYSVSPKAEEKGGGLGRSGGVWAGGGWGWRESWWGGMCEWGWGWVGWGEEAPVMRLKHEAQA